MHIKEILVSQRQLRNPSQVLGMVQSLETLPPIILAHLENGQIQIEDGHHRLTSYWLTGREQLFPYEYLLVCKDQHRPYFGHVWNLIERTSWFCGKELNLQLANFLL